MIDVNNVYYLRSAMKRTALHADSVSEDIPQYRALALGGWKPATPIAFKHDSGGKAYDVVTTTYAVVLLVSDRMAEALSGFSGWTTYPVELSGKDKKPIEGYHGFAVTGRCGPLDRLKGRELWRDHPIHPKANKHRRLFFYFDPNTWDGSDIFCPEGTLYIFIVPDVMQALKRAKITNIEMCRLPEW